MQEKEARVTKAVKTGRARKLSQQQKWETIYWGLREGEGWSGESTWTGTSALIQKRESSQKEEA